jgi:hypothetical protein
MNKADLLGLLFYGHNKTLGYEVNKEIYENAEKFKGQHSMDSDPAFIRALYMEMPELSVMDVQFVKRKLMSINNALNTIKTVMVLSFIITILGIFAYLISVFMPGLNLF